MQVKAKFHCNSINDVDYGHGHGNRTVKFHAVYDQNGENATFSKSTPSGELSMLIDKSTPAYDHFQPGKSYYLTIEEAPAQ